MKIRNIFALCILSILSVAIIQAPAAWLSSVITHYSHGAIMFEKSWGTIWQGTAQLRINRSSKESLVVPQPIAWTLHINPFKNLSILTELRSTALSTPVQFILNKQQISISAGQYSLPANSLTTLGAPFNTLKPSGNITLEWVAFTQPLNIKTPPTMPIILNILNLRTAITDSTVLGDYRFTATPNTISTGATFWELGLSTREDTGQAAALLLSGNGQLNPQIQGQGALQFELQAKAANTASQQRLGALLNFLGRKEGDAHILKIQ